MEQLIQKTIERLKKNNFTVKYFENKEDAVEEILMEIKLEDTVGIGGSMTIKELKLDTLLKNRGNTVHWHWLEANPEDMNNARKSAAFSDLYLTSTNALTQDGKLVNTDGMGNRVSAMFYGPKKTIVVCGVNKIAENVDSALERIEMNAYKNARRLNLNTPCAINESCIDCESPQRMCNITTIIRKKPMQKEFTIIIINEELGF